MDLDKLSDTAYGNLLILTLVIIALLFNIFPFNLFGLIASVLQIFIFLQVRFKLDKPIHATGLNKCYICTSCFYILLFALIRFLPNLISNEITFMVCTIITCLSCYSTSERSTDKGKINKVFWGRRKENGKYKDLFRLVKFEPNNKHLCEYENRMKEFDVRTYIIFKGIFRDDKTWDEVMILADIWERKDLDKEIYSIYKTLQYVCNLTRLD